MKYTVMRALLGVPSDSPELRAQAVDAAKELSDICHFRVEVQDLEIQVFPADCRVWYTVDDQ
jgi:hypothetical protein